MLHTAKPDPENQQWELSIYRVADGTQEANLELGFDEGFPRVLRRMGDLVIIASNFVLQVVDPQRARIVGTFDFERQFSFFVYAEPGMRVADSDAQGFVVVTTDGRLRYFASEDFPSSGPPQVPRPLRGNTRSPRLHPRSGRTPHMCPRRPPSPP